MLNNENSITILYVEDEDDVREGYARALKRISTTLITAEDGEIGLKLYKEHLPDIVVSDIKMPNMNGIEMAKAIRTINPNTNIIFTSAHSESAYLLEAIELQVEGYLLKPVDKKLLVSLVKKLSKNILLQKENDLQREIVQHIMDSENSISLVFDAKEISYASKSFLTLTQAESIEHFKETQAELFNTLYKNLYQHISLLNNSNNTIIINNKSFLISISKITQTNFLLNLTDITKMEEDRVITTKKAYIDRLTQVYNRNKFEEVFEYQLKQVKRNHHPFCLAMLDIDHFKEFNDTYGHLIGDEILILLSQTMLNDMRESDLFARWGGEEFVILFNNTNITDALALSQRFRKHIENMQHSTDKQITASFGVTQYIPNDTMKRMIQRADEALYKAKESGRNRVESNL